ncbi:TPA: hypothetical protein N0F65_010689 [Lagenidium giganteum]|uniref:Uncharacterized protein n=1 Tax=Lagenidium giganteum TaxID=4803 RepID=A0AAV2Z8Y5_9STRA|nr:TPA: hypothetical protein N0F65_010689 [Lagenidium giganteum]
MTAPPVSRTSRNSKATITPSALFHARRHTRRLSTFRGVEDAATKRKLTIAQVVGCMYNWILWFALTTLVFSQFLGVIWNTVKFEVYALYGRSPLLGTSPISGLNDEPYTDRSIVCALQGRMYKPMQLHKALVSSKAVVVDSNGSTINGYRVIARPEESQCELEQAVHDFYTKRCDALASTLDTIFDSCQALGYNVTRDQLRIVDDLASNVTKSLTTALPILLLPYWDNAIYARYAIPTWDGYACVFRLIGKYDMDTQPKAYLRSVSRSVRVNKTLEWLGNSHAGGKWENGWYEDTHNSMRWFSDVISTNIANPYGIYQRQFDTITNTELNCSSDPTICSDFPVTEWWGSKFSSTGITQWFTSVAISNGTHYGLFIYEDRSTRIVGSVYDVETFLSNFSLGMIFARWMVCMVALQNGYRLGLTRWFNTGIGCLSCSTSFHILPFVLLPRLKTTLAAFFALGCPYEGEMKALVDAWFVIYPAIGELMLFYYSLLNIVAKISRRRLRDDLFGPSILFFCVMHYYRSALGQTQWFEFDGRVTTIFSSSEFDQLRTIDFFISDVALRMNGNIRSLFGIKLSVLALSLLPLVIRNESTSVFGHKCANTPIRRTEKALAVRVTNVGGWGMSSMYDEDSSSSVSTKTVNAYELVRLGYIVYGGKYVLKIDDWYLLLIFALFRKRRQPPTYRIVLFTIQEHSDQSPSGATMTTRHIGDRPQLCSLNDARLQNISPWHIATCPFH